MIKKIGFEILVILALSIIAGLINNTFSHNRVAWIGSWPSFSNTEDDSTWNCLSCEPNDPPLLNLAEASALYQNPEVIFLDARFHDEYERGHIARAILLSFEKFDDYWPDVAPLIDTSMQIVTYCSGKDCETSLFLARLLRDDYGFKHVKVFFGGWRRWKKADLPIEYSKQERDG